MTPAPTARTIDIAVLRSRIEEDPPRILDVRPTLPRVDVFSGVYVVLGSVVTTRPCPGAAEEICCCDSARSGWRSWCEFGCRRAGGVGAARTGSQTGERPHTSVRFAFYGRVSTEDWQDPVASRAAAELAAGRHAGRGARDDRGRVLRHRGRAGLCRGAAPAGRRPGGAARGPGPRLGRDRDRGVRAGVLRQPVRVDGAAVRALRHRAVDCRRSAGESTGTPRTTSRPCSRSACRRNGRSPAPGSGSAPRWRPRPGSRAGTWAGARRTGTGSGTRGRTRTRPMPRGDGGRTALSRIRPRRRWCRGCSRSGWRGTARRGSPGR